MREETEEVAVKTVEEKPQRPKRHRGVVLFLCVLLIGGVGFFLWQLLAGPAKGTVHQGKLPAAPEAFSLGNEMKHYSGQYANFSYPGAYVEKRHDLPENNPVKETIFLSAADFEGRKIAITVEERPEKDFEASPSFQMRMNKPKEYEKSPLSDAGLRGFFFMKKTAVYEQDAFFFAKGFLVSVAVVSPTTADGLRDELLGILKSFVVKK